MTVQVVRLGDRQVPGVTPVGVSRPSLEQLTDVADTAAAPVDVPLVLRKGVDGVFRPESAAAADLAAVEDLIDAAIDSAVSEHRADDDPHPAYDDLPSLALLFENRLI